VKARPAAAAVPGDPQVCKAYLRIWKIRTMPGRTR
jgi:hypothetical protein